MNRKLLPAVAGLLIVAFAASALTARAAPAAPGLTLLQQQRFSASGLAALHQHFSLDLAAPATMVHLVMQLKPGGSDRLRQAGYPVEAQIGDIATTTVSLDQLDELAANPDVLAIEPAKRYRPLLDQSILDARVDGLRSRSEDGQFAGLTGKGVIVGVVDTGIDWRHPDFRRPDGTTRIKYLWDPADSSYAQSGGGVGSPPPAGGTGTVYTEAQINAGLFGVGTVNTGDECGHGTHVTGIAAGNGAAGGGGLPPGTFVGVAPEADIIVVRVFDAQCFYLNGVSLVAAMNFIDQKATQLGQPYVINFSLGSQIGGHDGLDPEELAIDALVGPGKPGKAVVAAAGNDANAGVHVGGTFGGAGSPDAAVNIEVSQFSANTALFDFWFNTQDTFKVTLSGGGKPVEDITSKVVLAGFLRAKRLLFMTERAPSFTITITGQIVANGRFDGWLEGNAVFQSSQENSRLISIPGTARNAITVGAHTTKTTWTDKNGDPWRVLLASLGEPASFTSPGPTRDGRQKPELSAPGQVIASSLSSSVASIFFPDFTILRDEQHAIAQGTSASAPHVTGAIALLFQSYPRLDAELARQLLIGSARNDFVNQPTPSLLTGYGKLDVAAALLPGSPQAFLSVNQPNFLPGERLVLDYALQADAEEGLIDCWVSVQLPDGRLAFLKSDSSGFSFEPRPYRSDFQLRDLAGQLFSVTVPATLPAGTYTFRAVGTMPGTDPAFQTNWVTNLATQTVQILP